MLALGNNFVTHMITAYKTFSPTKWSPPNVGSEIVVVPVLVGRPDGGERQLQLKLASAVDEVALLQLREQHKLAAPVRCSRKPSCNCELVC